MHIERHRIFSDIPGDVAVDFRVEFQSMLSGRATKAQTPSPKVTKPPKNRRAALGKRFPEDSFKGLFGCKRTRIQIEIDYSSVILIPFFFRSFDSISTII